jgi:hypothetical protein
MKLLNYLLCWIKMLFFKIIGKRMIDLPTITNANGDALIDKARVENVVLFECDGKLYFYCTIDGAPHVLNHSQGLEQWFKDSGIPFVSVGTFFVAQKLEPKDVANLPVKYLPRRNHKP